jgi:hypothetical protein
MGCEYYIQSELIIEFRDKDGKICTIYTDRELQKGYLFSYSDNNSDDDMKTQNKKYHAELMRRIEQHTNNKMLFENENWIKESYKKKYEDYILKTFNRIHKLKKFTKKLLYGGNNLNKNK